MAAPPTDVIVNIGSPVGRFSHNKQNGPAVAIDAPAPIVVVAGANDEIDDEACAAGDPTTCLHPRGRGVRGLLLFRRRLQLDAADLLANDWP